MKPRVRAFLRERPADWTPEPMEKVYVRRAVYGRVVATAIVIFTVPGYAFIRYFVGKKGKRRYSKECPCGIDDLRPFGRRRSTNDPTPKGCDKPAQGIGT